LDTLRARVCCRGALLQRRILAAKVGQDHE
jgi:hypothetical protein